MFIDKTFIGIVIYLIIRYLKYACRCYKNAKLMESSNKDIVTQEIEFGSGFGSEIVLGFVLGLVGTEIDELMYSVQLSHVPSHFFMVFFPVRQFAFLNSHGLL